MTHQNTRLPLRPFLAVATLTALSALSACAGAPAASAPESTVVPHGYVAGATEEDEPQTRLSYLDAGSDTIATIDPLTGTEDFTVSVPGATKLAHDGRFLFVTTTAAAPLRVIDTGVWTKEHGDHKHFYRAAAQQLESSAALPAGAVAGDGNKVTVFNEASGTTSVVSRDALDAGETNTEITLPGTPHVGLAVPYKGHLLVTAEPNADRLPTKVAAYDGTGASESLAKADCPALQGHAITSYGTVFGCSDGVLIISESDGSLSASKLPYPKSTTGERIISFNSRPGSSELTALAGTAGLWHLDVAAEKIQFMQSPEPLLTTTTAGNGEPTLAVGASGTLFAFNVNTHAVEAQSHLLPVIKEGEKVSLAVDNSRAYLSHSASRLIHEIDYRDTLRVSRTFTTSGAPSQLLETGL